MSTGLERISELAGENRQLKFLSMEVLRKRFAKYGLTLHPEKTRLIEFGRSAVGKAE